MAASGNVIVDDRERVEINDERAEMRRRAVQRQHPVVSHTCSTPHHTPHTTTHHTPPHTHIHHTTHPPHICLGHDSRTYTSARYVYTRMQTMECNSHTHKHTHTHTHTHALHIYSRIVKHLCCATHSSVRTIAHDSVYVCMRVCVCACDSALLQVCVCVCG